MSFVIATVWSCSAPPKSVLFTPKDMPHFKNRLLLMFRLIRTCMSLCVCVFALIYLNIFMGWEFNQKTERPFKLTSKVFLSCHSLRIPGPSYRVVWMCIAGFWVEILWFFGFQTNQRNTMVFCWVNMFPSKKSLLWETPGKTRRFAAFGWSRWVWELREFPMVWFYIG